MKSKYFWVNTLAFQPIYTIQPKHHHTGGNTLIAIAILFLALIAAVAFF
jgi:hypothetical protein